MLVFDRVICFVMCAMLNATVAVTLLHDPHALDDVLLNCSMLQSHEGRRAIAMKGISALPCPLRCSQQTLPITE